MVFQEAVLFDWRTITKNISLPLELAGWDRSRRTERVKEMIDLVELGRLREPPPVGALRRHADARRDRPRALLRPEAAADGRAVRRARRDDTRAAQPRAAADLGGERLDRGLRHALDHRGGLPLDARRRDAPAARAGSPASSTSTCRSRAAPTRARSRASSSWRPRSARLLRGPRSRGEAPSSSSRRHEPGRPARARVGRGAAGLDPALVVLVASSSAGRLAIEVFDIQRFLLPKPRAIAHGSGTSARRSGRRAGSRSRRRSGASSPAAPRRSSRRSCSHASGRSARR